MSALQPFNADATCPKCGHDEVGANHWKVGEYLYADGYARGERERIRRHCGRCGWNWDEAPLDAPRATGEGGRG